MNKHFLFFFVFLFVVFSCQLPVHGGFFGAFFRYRYGIPTTVRLKVVDEEGNPVQDAMVNAHFLLTSTGRVKNIEKPTDENGFVEITGRCNDYEVAITITKEGYYETYKDIRNLVPGHCPGVEETDSGLVYAPKQPYVLKSIRNPIPMLRFWGIRFTFPELGIPYGYDLEYGSMVEPYGDGKVADMYFTLDKEEKEGSRFKIVKITFPNELDGAYIAPLYRLSKFWSPYYADPDADYRKEFVFSLEINDENGTGTIKELITLSEDEAMIIRSRTRVDATGKLVSAHYGKIYGEFMMNSTFNFKRISTDCYTFFNPVENDNNLESDDDYHYELRKGKRQIDSSGWR